MYLGIDLGISEVKVLLLAGDGGMIGTAGTPFTVSRPKPRWSEQNPLDWWEGTRAALFKLREKFPNEAQVRGIGLSGQMHGAVLLDSYDNVLRPADPLERHAQRQGMRRALRARAEPARDRRQSGDARLHCTEAPVGSAQRARRLQADRLRALAKGLFAHASDGHEGVRSDPSDAAGALWLDVARRDWSDELLAACSMSRQQMPSLAEGIEPSGTLRPELAREFGLREGMVVAAGGGDHAASAVGIGATDPGDGFLSLGTSGVLCVIGDSFRPNPASAVHAFCHAIPDRWHQMSVVLSAASCLRWVCKLTSTDEPTLLAEVEHFPPICCRPRLCSCRT